MADTPNIKESLEAAVSVRDLTIEELVQSAGELLQRVAPEQTRYKVSERPDVRTIRYYINQKLLPRPTGYQGGKARFTGSHLLRLLMIKKLQAEHQTLRQIGRLLRASTDLQLQELLVQPRSDLQVVPPSEPTTAAVGVIQRVVLPGGGNLDLPLPSLRNPKVREELAAKLESLAQKIRSNKFVTEGE